MANQQIIDYLRQNAQYPREALRAQLQSSGYAAADIAAAESAIDAAGATPEPPAVNAEPVMTGVRTLHPRATIRFFFTYLGRLLFLGGYFALQVLVSPGDNSGMGWGLLLIVIVFIAGAYGWAMLAYRYYKYELTDIGFKKELGVIRKKYVTIPYDRIQNIDMSRSLLDRILGLTVVHIQTAGSSGSSSRRSRGAAAEGRIPGISHEAAEALREEIMGHVGATSGHGV